MLTKYNLVNISNVEDVELREDIIVHDIQVEDDCSYVVGDNIIVHNSVCISKNKTGFFRPMVSTLEECVSVAKVPIIADGGIEQHGDVAKALVVGATMVMAGHLFAGYDISAGEIIEIEDRQYKEYFGSASKYNKREQKNIEGRKILIPYRGSIEDFLVELKQDLQSAISYAGGKDLSVFKNVQYRMVL